MSRARPSRPDRRRLAVAAGTVGILVLAGAGWASTRLGEYSVMSMGHVVDGRGGTTGLAASAHHSGQGGGQSGAAAPSATTGEVDVTSLVAEPNRVADVTVELLARRGLVRVAGGRSVEGYTVNGTSPGPTIRVRQGQLVEVTFVNESVACRGDAALARRRRAQRRRRRCGRDAGRRAGGWALRLPVRRGGRGHVLVPLPPGVARAGPEAGCSARSWSIRPTDLRQPRRSTRSPLLHVYAGQHTLNGAATDASVRAPAGTRCRRPGGQHRPGHRDGLGIRRPSASRRRTARRSRVRPTSWREQVAVSRGGRVDLTVVVPDAGARLHVGGARSILIGPEGRRCPRSGNRQDPRPARLRLTRPARVRPHAARPRLRLRHRPRSGSSTDVPAASGRSTATCSPTSRCSTSRRVTSCGSVSSTTPARCTRCTSTVTTSSSSPRTGSPATGSPWFVDSLDVHPGESYEVAFVADNPGIWSDHCHTLQHAVDGLIAHLMYEGVTTRFTIGGDHANHPE